MRKKAHFVMFIFIKVEVFKIEKTVKYCLHLGERKGK